MSAAVTVEEFPLFLDPSTPNVSLNYLLDPNKPVWNIATLARPLYLYQPTIELTPTGPHVKTDLSTRKARSHLALAPVRKYPSDDPTHQPWLLVARDGIRFNGTSDGLTRSAILQQCDAGFTLQMVDRSVRASQDRHSSDIPDAEAAAKLQRDRELAQEAILAKRIPNFEAVRRKERAAREAAAAEAQASIEESAYYKGAKGSSDDDADDDIGADLDVDADAGQDDDDNAVDEIDLDDLFELSDIEPDVSDSDEEEEADEDGKKKKKSTDAPAEKIVTNEAIEAIVREVVGPEMIKREELIRYVLGEGFVKSGQLTQRFKGKIEKPEQREHFKQLVRDNLTLFKHSGDVCFKVKTAKR
jgi:hypothetical protein